MDRLLKRAAAAVTAGLMMISSGIGAYAEDDVSDDPYADLVLPSGMTASKVINEINEMSRRNHDDPDHISAAVGIFCGNDVIHTGYYGYADLENRIPEDEGTVYEWGSISKTLVWVSVMQLMEQGKLDLDRDVREYLPDGFFRKLSYDDPITMMNLMDHNAGWQETTLPIWKTDGDTILSLKEELQAIEPAQIHRPGEVTAYSNYGAAVAGYVVECVSGMDYCEYVHKNILEPLGMEHTAIYSDHSDNAYVYEKRRQTKCYERILFGNIADKGNMLYYVGAYPAGAAAGTLSDLITYAQALTDDDAPLFRDKATQELMFSPTDFYGSSDIPICAHGFWFSEYGVRTIGHDGATLAGQAAMMFDPLSKTGAVVMVNEPSGNLFLTDVPSLVFGSLTDERYGGDNAEKEAAKGSYLPARARYKGLMRFSAFMSATDLSKTGEMESLGSGVHQIVVQDPMSHEKKAMLLGERTYPGGGRGFAMPSTDLIYDGAYLWELLLLTAYVLMAGISVYMMMIRRKLKKHGRSKGFAGAGLLTVSRVTRIVSVVLFLAAYALYARNNGGISYSQGAVIGTGQIICMAVFALTAVAALIIPIVKKEKPMRYIMSSFGNILSLTAVLYFDMYLFWGI